MSSNLGHLLFCGLLYNLGPCKHWSYRHYATWHFNVGTGNLNPGSHACTTRTWSHFPASSALFLVLVPVWFTMKSAVPAFSQWWLRLHSLHFAKILPTLRADLQLPTFCWWYRFFLSFGSCGFVSFSTLWASEGAQVTHLFFYLWCLFPLSVTQRLSLNSIYFLSSRFCFSWHYSNSDSETLE